MPTAILAINPNRPAAFEAAGQAAEHLWAAGWETMRYLAFSPRDPLSYGAALPSLGEVLPGTGLLLTFGGDGTFLHGAKLAAEQGIPVLGVNVGSLGFLTGLAPDELPLLACLPREDLPVQHRMMLEVTATRDGKELLRETALNDAVVCRGNRGGVIHLRVDWGEGPSALDGDGLIVSTPTGSTGYSLSAGGPVLEGEAANILLAPVCPQDPRKKPLVLLPRREVRITLAGQEEAGAVLSVDGSPGPAIRPDTEVTIRCAEREALFLRFLPQTKTKE